MKIILYSILFCFLSFIMSCSKDIISEPSENNGATSLEIVSSTSSTKASFCVTPSMVSRYIQFAIKEKNVEHIEPIVEGNDTLAFYVQYSFNKGWDLISADTRMTPILVSSPSGTLLGTESFIKDMALETVNTVKVVKQSPESKIENIWAYITKLDETKTNNHLTNNPDRGLTQGMWIPIDTTFTFDTTTSNRIISTKWGQNDPWYRYTPYESYYMFNIHTHVGCVPVAVAQILYRYLYQTNGLYPIPDSVFFDSEPHFISYTTDWSGFAETSQNSNDAAINKTAKFLSWIGHLTNTEYHASSPSLTNPQNGFDILDDYLNYNSTDNFNSSIVFYNLLSSIPVYISADNLNDTTTGHSFIIDGYKIIRYQMVVNYEFDPYYNVTEDEYFNSPSWMFEWPSPGQFPNYDPEKEPAIMPVSTDLSNVTYFFMNWGHNGNGDDIAFSSNSLNWTHQNTTYNHLKRMLYNFTRKN